MLTVIGDVHGQIDALRDLLRGAELTDALDCWAGGATALWFLGDYFDRGPDGIAVIELIMRLQEEAQSSGGVVGALIGNHDVHLLAAHELGDEPDGSRQGTFLASWHANGGEDRDLQRLTSDHVAWLKALPAMAIVEDRLLAHADATFYNAYGDSIARVNEAIREVLHTTEAEQWDTLLNYFSQRRAFVDRFLGRERAARFLRNFGGKQFVHAHTPITKLTGQPPEKIDRAYVYAGGLCVNVDHGLYMGGPGFVTHLDGAVTRG